MNLKKWLNVFYVVLAVLGGLWLSAQTLLLVILPWEPVQRFVQDEISKAAGRPVQASRIAARLSGLTLSDVRVASSASDPSKGELFRAEQIRVRWNPWHLLHGHVKITSVRLHGLDLNVIRRADGTFNFDGLFGAGEQTPDAPQPQAQDKPFDVNISMQSLRLTGGRLTFTDWQTNQMAEVSNVFLSVRDFHFDRAFPVSLNASLRYTRKGWSAQNAELGLTVWPELNRLELAGAGVNLKRVVFKHPGGVFVLSGGVRNFENPSADVKLSMRSLSDQLVRFAAPDVPAFTVDSAAVALVASADLTAQSANISSLNAAVSSATVYSSGAASAPDIELPEASVYLAAKADWNTLNVKISSFTAQALNSFLSLSGTAKLADKPVFDVSGAFEADLPSIGQAVAAMRPYQLRGTVGGAASGTQDSAAADVHVRAVGAALPQAGTLSDFNTRVRLKDINHLNIDAFEGQINGGKFSGSLFVRRTPQAVNVDFKADAPRIALPPAPKQTKTEPEPAPDEKLAQTSKAAPQDWPLPPFNVKAAVNVGSLDAPYIFGENIRFSADLKQLTPSLAQAQGELALDTGKGEIKDLNKLTNANVLTKVMFGSLSAVSKVINSLNVFAVLNGIGSGMVSAVSPKEEKPADMVVQTVKDENGNDVQILVPYTAQNVDGILAFEQFGTDVAFKDGEADVKKGSFVSDLMSFNLQGDMNFKTQGLDMTVHAAPGRHYEGGIMPLTITIGGTIDNPQGSMSMTSSLTSLVTQGVANNFASRSVKKGLGGLFGLFKKKKPQEAQPQEENARAAAQPQDAAAPAPQTAAVQEAEDGQEASAQESVLQPAKPTQTSANKDLPLPPAEPDAFVGGAGFAPAP